MYTKAIVSVNNMMIIISK